MVRFCLDFAVVKNKKLLLLKRAIEPSKGWWGMPGGMVQKGESIKKAAKRILMTETGLTPLSMGEIGHIEFVKEHIKNNQSWTHSISLVFLVKATLGNLKKSFQHQDFDFFSKLPKKINPRHGAFLKKNWKSIAQ